MDDLRTILNKKEQAEIIEKKSKFIANIFYVESVRRSGKNNKRNKEKKL